MIKVNNKYIGEGQPCFVVAEVGINHNGDMDLAMKSIDAAVLSGADAVKFQNYFTEDFILDKKLTYEYTFGNKKVSETQFEMFKRNELSFEQLEKLKKHCDKKGIIFFSTPTGQRGIDDLLRLQTPLLKNGSDFLVNLEIIEAMARTRLPTIISTGMATLAEIDDAVRAFEKAGGKELIILHCISSYPTPADEVNLLKIPALKQAFGYSIGFSDHSEGIVAGIGSVVLGSCFIEKHFTLDKNLPGPDHSFSSDPNEFKNLVDGIRIIEKNLGQARLNPTAKEEYGRMNYRLSCVARIDLPSGHEIGKSDIAYSRPANGLPPKLAHLLHGKILKKPLKAGDLIGFETIQ